MIAKLVILSIYLGSFISLQRYLNHNPPEFKDSIKPFARPLWALLRLWGPSLGFVLSLLWFSLLPFPMLLLSLFIPPMLFLALTIWAKVSLPSITGFLLAFLTLCTLLTTLMLKAYAFSATQLLTFLFFSITPILFTIALLFLFTPLIIPTDLDPSVHQRKALAMLISFFTRFPKPTFMVVNGKTEPRILGDSYNGEGPMWILTEPENVVALTNGSTPLDVSGPGVIVKDETTLIEKVLDLREQLAIAQPAIETLTSDGVMVKVPLSTIFRIGKAPLTLDDLKKPWPYKKKDAYKLAFKSSISLKGTSASTTCLAWHDIPLTIARGELKKIIGEYSLRSLYDPTLTPTLDNMGAPRVALSQRLRESVKTYLEPKGFTISGGGIANVITPSEHVGAQVEGQAMEMTAQRKLIEAWQTRWLYTVKEELGKARAKRFTTFAHIQKTAREQLLNEITTATRTALRKNNGNFSQNLAAYHLLETLDSIAQESEIQALLPASARPTLAGLRQYTKEAVR